MDRLEGKRARDVYDPRKRLVEDGYDVIAEQYLASKDPEDPETLVALEDLAERLPPSAAVLELGCGAGVPATKWLAERFAVTGVDISEKQLALARKNVPEARFIRADMMKLDFEPETFDAVVAFVSIIHVPREEHPALFDDIRRWLEPGRYFLATLSIGEWEGEEPDWEGWGAAMWWSHYDGNENLRMLREAGFEIVSAEAKSGKGTGDEEETWLWVLARRPSGTAWKSTTGSET